MELQVQASPECMLAEVHGETLLLHVPSGKYYGLNVVGSRVWQLMQAPSTVSSIVGQLLLEFDADQERIRDDVVSLVESLKSAHLAFDIEATRIGNGPCTGSVASPGRDRTP